MEDEDRLLPLLPETLRIFLLYQANSNYNVEQLFDVHRGDGFFNQGVPWHEIEKHVRAVSASEQKTYYGIGTHHNPVKRDFPT